MVVVWGGVVIRKMFEKWRGMGGPVVWLWVGLVWVWGDGSGISRYGSGWVFDTST